MDQAQSVEQRSASPKDFFLYLASIITLYISVGSLLGLLFQIIDAAFPDPLQPYIDFYSTGIRLAIASLIVIFPLYLVIMRYLSRDEAANPWKRDLPIRKWLIYLTLFLAGALIAGDLIALINTFLSGEITSRFAFKVLSILVVAGYVFWYYISLLRQKADESKKGRRWVVIVPSAFIVISIIGGFFIMGSPFTQRQLRFDVRRVNDLQQIQSYIVTYYDRTNRLPENLEVLNDPVLGFVVPADPETKSLYTYEVASSTGFRLCATFSRQSPEDGRTSATKEFMYITGGENWQHEAGRYCFERIINPELLPSASGTVKPVPAF